MPPVTLVPTGTTYTFSGFEAYVDSFSANGATRASINTTHMATTTAQTFVGGTLPDWGNIVINGHYDPAVDPPMAGTAGNLVITFPGGRTWTASCFMIGYEWDAPFEDKATYTATFKISGKPTLGGGS